MPKLLLQALFFFLALYFEKVKCKEKEHYLKYKGTASSAACLIVHSAPAFAYLCISDSVAFYTSQPVVRLSLFASLHAFMKYTKLKTMPNETNCSSL